MPRLVNCPICEKEVKPLGLAAHKRMAHYPTHRPSDGLKGKPAHNKGKKYEDYISEDQASQLRKDKAAQAIGRASPNFSPASRERMAEHARRRNIGGYKQGSGRGKKGWYKGYWCDSSWELAWVIYQLDHGVVFKRCNETFEYEFEGSIKKYHPDFLVNDEYIEIKGYTTAKWETKLAQFPLDKTLHVLSRKEIEPYLTYARETYGKGYISLYTKTK